MQLFFFLLHASSKCQEKNKYLDVKYVSEFKKNVSRLDIRYLLLSHKDIQKQYY